MINNFCTADVLTWTAIIVIINPLIDTTSEILFSEKTIQVYWSLQQRVKDSYHCVYIIYKYTQRSTLDEI